MEGQVLPEPGAACEAMVIGQQSIVELPEIALLQQHDLGGKVKGLPPAPMDVNRDAGSEME